MAKNSGSDMNGVEMSMRRQGTVKETGSLGAEMGQGGTYHHSSEATLPALLGQGKNNKKGANFIKSLGGLIGQR